MYSMFKKIYDYYKSVIELIRKTGYEYQIKRDPSIFIRNLRKAGVDIDDGVIVPNPETIKIDLTRPSLITIGKGALLHRNLRILTHDFVTRTFLKKYGEFVPCSGKVSIGENVWIGMNCTCLKGADIGDNCIIGYGSVVMGKIPPNSVAAGCPAKVICTLDEYFEKRKQKCIEEAFEYARSIQERFGRRPVPADFREEFTLFVSGDEVDKYPEIPIESQMMGAFDNYLKNHKAKFHSFDEFLEAAGL